MNGYFAYIRVSTPKQGEGVSLQEQRNAIERYAAQHQLRISAWFEETETAAKRGRRTFRSVLEKLTKRQAVGLIVHRIDRSTRNLRDWADIGELIDWGVDVRFVHDNLDMGSRGGRLAADIQAVIAADYVRNLRDEVRKGILGRLKQGLYPLPAPLGYLDRGRGRTKVIDPLLAPKVVELFERYAAGQDSFKALEAWAAIQGLAHRDGRPLSDQSIARILRNPFYAGLLRIRSQEHLFPGIHQPLITQALFEQAQAIDQRGAGPSRQAHQYLFRGLVRCGCGRAITGETSKSHVYYRCHRATCRGTALREEALADQLRNALGSLELDLTPELENLCRPLEERWRRELGIGRDPRLEEAIARTRTAAQHAETRIQRFRSLLISPLAAFDAASAPVKRELVMSLVSLTLEKRVLTCAVKTPLDPFFRPKVRTCDRVENSPRP